MHCCVCSGNHNFMAGLCPGRCAAHVADRTMGPASTYVAPMIYTWPNVVWAPGQGRHRKGDPEPGT